MKRYSYTKDSLVEVIRRYCRILSDRADEMVGDMKGLQSITFTMPVTMYEMPRIVVEKTIVDIDALSAVRFDIPVEEETNDEYLDETKEVEGQPTIFDFFPEVSGQE